MKVPTEAQRSHIYTQVENATDATTAEFLVGILPTSKDDRLATYRDVLMVKKDLVAVQADIKGEVASVKSEVANLKSEVLLVKGEAANVKSEVLLVKKDLEVTTANLTALITEKISAAQASNARWMFTMLLMIIAAMAAVYFAP